MALSSRPSIAKISSTSPSTLSSPSSSSICVAKRKRLSRKERKLRKKQKSVHSPSTTPSSAPKTTSPHQTHDVNVNGNNDAGETEVVDYLVNYIPTPMSKSSLKTSKTCSLGKWFPKGRVLKPVHNNNNHAANTTATTESSLVLFYQYLPSSQLWSTSRVDALMDYLTHVFEHLHQRIGGRIRVAREGVNATISAITDEKESSSSSSLLSAAHLLRHLAQDLIQFDPIFQQTDFKYIDHLPADRHFKDLKILPVQELVFYGKSATAVEPVTDSRHHKEQDSSTTNPGTRVDQQKEEQGGAKHVDAVEFHQLLQEDDAVVIDVRNHYEAAIGRFAPPPVVVTNNAEEDDDNNDKEQRQQQQVKEKYIDPRMRKSTDFIPWLQQPSTQEKLRNKKVLMYCTGGIRCEKASVYLEQEVGDQVQGIYQLKGGIERYMKTFAAQGGGFWKGHNFVFDKREAVSSDQPQGVGGVYRKKPEGKDATAKSLLLPTSYCCLCEKPWDRYLGKKKCDTCGVPVLMCETCLTHHSSAKKKKQTPPSEESGEAANVVSVPLARCPLCVQENITVPAALVEFTDNGKKIGKWIDPSDAEGGGGSMICAPVLDRTTTNQNSIAGSSPTFTKKAAPSVLKWGGGHAAEKKVMRKLKRKQCRFGAECLRKDCFFAHPEKNKTTSKS